MEQRSPASGIDATRLVLLFAAFTSTASITLAQGGRPPAVAGKFYPGEMDDLKKTVSELLARAAPVKLPGETVAMLVPHAGYVYSGPTAARGYKALKGKWDTFVIIGAGHRYPVKGAAVSAEGSFRTPLGNVIVNRELCMKLFNESPLIFGSARAHRGEHSIEVQLPFLQTMSRDFTIVPMVMNLLDMKTCKEVGEAIGRALKDEKALVLISSDLSHYPARDVASVVDRTTLLSMEFMNPSYFRATSRSMRSRRIPELSCTYCGEAATIAGMFAANALGADRVVPIEYLNSGQLKHGDPNRVVGYASVAFVRTGKDGRRRRPRITADEKAMLRKVARESIVNQLNGKPSTAPLYKNPELNLPAAVFVTLKKGGRLRGCIGSTVPRMPLVHAVMYSARQAAFNDHRFKKLQKEELAGLEIEISVLSPLRKVSSADEIVPGKHGVAVSIGNKSGLFLPQVWGSLTDKELFLSELCSQKAHLPRNAWKDSRTNLMVFTVEKF